MDSAMIGKIMKSKQYAQDPERFEIHDLELLFKGDHTTHKITFHEGKWHCDCDFFQQRGVCAHTMAVERRMEGMLVEPENEETEVVMAAAVAV